MLKVNQSADHKFVELINLWLSCNSETISDNIVQYSSPCELVISTNGVSNRTISYVVNSIQALGYEVFRSIGIYMILYDSYVEKHKYSLRSNLWSFKEEFKL